MRHYPLASAALLVLLSGPVEGAAEPSLAGLVEKSDWAAVKALGPTVLPELAGLYAAGDESRRSQIASLYYYLGWQSPAAKAVLLRDIHTENVDLRINVQYALGRVSSDEEVVDGLLANMRHDPDPLIRDKAACALAYDQIHLSERQKVRLFAGLIAALEDREPQVRGIAILALQIHTGQRKGFVASAPPGLRAEAIECWRAWLSEYQAQQ